MVKLRISLPKGKNQDFEIAWESLGRELMVIENGKRMKVGAAAKQKFGRLPKKGKVAFDFGKFINYAKEEVKEIGSYRQVYQAIQSRKRMGEPGNKKNRYNDQTALEYFKDLSSSKTEKVKVNILERPLLWESFLSRKQLTQQDFKRLSTFKPHSISGFTKYITDNKFAKQDGYKYILNEAILGKIRQLLDQDSKDDKIKK